LLLSLCAVTTVSSALLFAQAPATPAPTTVAPATPVAAAPAVPTPPPTALAFDADSKEYKAKVGDATAPFTFNVTNTWNQPIKITALRPSCGCTAAQLPNMPYELGAGSNVPINVSVDLRGKMGLVTKSLGVESGAGFKSLLLRIDIPQPQPTAPAPNGAPTVSAAPATGAMADRAKNIQLSLNDRQAVFKGDCRSCHVDKGIAKLGKELYEADCAICHDDQHRAAMVPDLKVPRSHRDLAFWQTWVSEGKVGTMMPAFGQEHGGPLTKEQVTSLVNYLYQNYPKDPAASPVAQQQAKLPLPPLSVKQ